MSNDRRIIVDALRDYFKKDILSRQEIADFVANSNNKYSFPHWLCNTATLRVGRGMYRLPDTAADASNASVIASAIADITKPRVVAVEDSMNYIPDGIEGYYPFGNHNDIMQIILSRRFCPVFISGLSGCGKTTTVLQVCAENKIECIRVNITCETDEDDLLGGFRLMNGETVFSYGPVVEAMRRGAVLILDEVDLASNKIMCLQPVLEGKGVFLKKIGEQINPAPGFNIIATANTKGQGSDNGKFIGTSVLNEAFLDRFAITMDQAYPSKSVETKILRATSARYNRNTPDDHEFIDKLVLWADATRSSHKEGATDEVISTRRLNYIIELYSIFGNRSKAIKSVLCRFDEETATAFYSLYEKFDASIGNKNIPTSVGNTVVVPLTDSNPFGTK